MNLRGFSGRNRFGREWFDKCFEIGDRDETAKFEAHFREHAALHLEAWYEVVFWKMASQRGRANIQTERAITRVIQRRVSARDLSLLCAAYVQGQSKDSFTRSQDELVKSDSIAVAFTFPAFYCPGSFPMVDTRVARYIASEGTEAGFPSSPEIQKTLERYRTTGGGVLTLSDWGFVEAWVSWCRETARRLTDSRATEWRARDVEMAVFRAWGDRKERNGLAEWKSRYKLSSNRAVEPKKAAPTDQAWFERKVAELKAELDKLPADRQDQLRRELEDESEKAEE